MAERAMSGRREFLKSAAGLVSSRLLPVQQSAVQSSVIAVDGAATLPAWQPGWLEVHHIDTGRGNAALVLGPDGTSLLIDAGEAHSNEKAMSKPRPDASRRAGEWVARYVQRQLARVGVRAQNRVSQKPVLDRVLLTHLHGDHVGEVVPSSPQSSLGPYRLTGAAYVAESMTIGQILDRGWPDYGYPLPPTDPSALNFIALARHLSRHGTQVLRSQAGAVSQLALLHNPAAYPDFQARILSVNGEVWDPIWDPTQTGHGARSKPLFPAIAGLSPAALPTENMCCVSLRIDHGKFRYYAGGDLSGDPVYGKYPWHDIETPVAQLAGPVSVAVANHHGYFDSNGPGMVRALQPRAWIIPCWHASHPALSVLANLYSTDLYPGDRSVFAVGISEAAMLVTDRFSGRLASASGHVVVRVPPGGEEFHVHVVDSRDERGSVMASFGPFPS